MNRWSKLKALTASERKILLAALIALPATAFGLRFFGLGRMQSLLARTSRGIHKDPEDNSTLATEATRIARVVRIASDHGFYRGNCLQQSLVLWWALRLKKIETVIRLGARKNQAELAAHAWVELNGIALNEAGDVSNRYPPFSRALRPMIGQDL